METETQIIMRTRMRPSESCRWLASHREKQSHAYVPRRPNISRRIDLQAETTVIDLRKPIPEVSIELPPMDQKKPRFGKRLLQGMKSQIEKGAEWLGQNRKKIIGAVAVAGVVTMSMIGAENQQSEGMPTNAAAIELYDDFSAQNPSVTYAEFDQAINSQEFADMSQWVQQNPGQDFSRAMSNFSE